MLYPDNFEQKIGFDRVRGLLKEACQSTLAQDEIDALAFISDHEELQARFALVSEMMILIAEGHEAMPLGTIADLRQAFARTRIVGTFLELDAVFAVRRNAEMVQQIVSFVLRCDEQRFPMLRMQIEEVDTFPELLKRIDGVIDKFGAIKDTASPDLQKIRRAMLQIQSSVSKTLQAILRQAQTDGLIDKEATPTMRDGRLVIPVPAMNKRALGGIIHDESATGKTAFVEPASVVELNNRLRELQSDERREIIRILIHLTDFLRPYYESLLNATLFLAKMDALQAKARFSLQISAICPELSSEPLLMWHEARHPLLERSLVAQGKKIVPLSIILKPEQRILLISGPNAGGKSVCLKTVGLLQYMLQTGLPIPVSEHSKAGMFDSLFIDIGDDQNIENDLSTYSSHLMNMKHCIRHSNQRTLLLIDEFGTGTEPQIGGAIAEAVLEEFVANGAHGVITTHYTNLKHYAANTDGVVNGAMLYDRHQMQPLFCLQIGQPGSSFAVEIARKIGLPEHVIASAANKVGSEHIDYDKNLQDAARDKRYWENKRQQIRLKEKQLEKIAADYQEKTEDLKHKQKELIRQAKTEAISIVEQANARIEQTIRSIKEHRADKEVTKGVRTDLKKYAESLVDLKQDTKKQKKEFDKEHAIAVGDTVCLEGQHVVGRVLTVSGKNGIVEFGHLRLTVALAKLEKVNSKQAKVKGSVSKGTNAAIRDKQLQFVQELDVRGMRVDEALQAVMYYVDDAQMINVQRVRILHGTGTGALRQAIREYLEANSAVASYADEHVQLGGAGITVVNMR